MHVTVFLFTVFNELVGFSMFSCQWRVCSNVFQNQALSDELAKYKKEFGRIKLRLNDANRKMQVSAPTQCAQSVRQVSAPGQCAQSVRPVIAVASRHA